MQENTTTKKLEIPMILDADWQEPDSDFQRRRLLNDVAGFYLGSIFYFIKTAARAQRIIDTSVDGPPLLDVNEFATKTELMCDIAEAVLSKIEAPYCPVCILAASDQEVTNEQ